MGQDREYVRALAEATNNLFIKGVRDPNALEIMQEYLPGKILGGEVAEGVRKRLHKIKSVLEEDYGLPVCLLSSTYYTRFRRKAIANREDARLCLPIGNAKRAEGIYLQSGTDDLIWQAAVEVTGNSGAAKVKKTIDRVLKAVENGRLTERRAGEILVGTKRRLIPAKPQLEERAIKALEEGSTED